MRTRRRVASDATLLFVLSVLELTRKVRVQTTNLSLTLSYEQRCKSRLRAALDQGGEAGIFLPHGGSLHDGDCLADANGRIVKIIAAAEPLSEVCCRDALRFARACYHLGNRHVPLQILTDCLRYRQDKVLDDLLRKLALQVTARRLPFEPEPGAYHNGHHDHAQSR